MHGNGIAELPCHQGNARHGTSGVKEVLCEVAAAYGSQGIQEEVSFRNYGCSSIGRAADSKSAGWGFKSLRPCLCRFGSLESGDLHVHFKAIPVNGKK